MKRLQTPVNFVFNPNDTKNIYDIISTYAIGIARDYVALLGSSLPCTGIVVVDFQLLHDLYYRHVCLCLYRICVTAIILGTIIVLDTQDIGIS